MLDLPQDYIAEAVKMDTGTSVGCRLAALFAVGFEDQVPGFEVDVEVTGEHDGIPGHVESLQLQTKLMLPGSEWEVIGISHGHWRMLATALVLGGNIRTGLEDHLYLPSGEMAKSNGELVEVAARLTRDVGRRPATVEEARQILGLRGAP